MPRGAVPGVARPAGPPAAIVARGAVAADAAAIRRMCRRVAASVRPSVDPRELSMSIDAPLRWLARETAYDRRPWIESSRALMRHELQVHNPGDAKTRTDAPCRASSTTGSPARIGLIRMRGAA